MGLPELGEELSLEQERRALKLRARAHRTLKIEIVELLQT